MPGGGLLNLIKTGIFTVQDAPLPGILLSCKLAKKLQELSQHPASVIELQYITFQDTFSMSLKTGLDCFSNYESTEIRNIS